MPSQLSETGFFRNQFEPKKILKLKGKKEFNLSMEDRAIKKLRKQAGCEGIDSKTAKKYFDLNYGIDIYDVISNYREEFDGKLPSEVLADPGSPNGFINTAYIQTSILADKLSSARTRFGFSGCKKERLYRLPNILKHFKKIKILTLPSNQFTHFPSWLKNLKRIEALDLSDCSLETVPEIIQQFRKLKILNFSNNEFEIVPAWLGDLVALRNLNLSKNSSLISLPIEMSKLVHLTHLDISQNDLTKMPEFVLKCLALEELLLKGNKINEIPYAIGDLKKLKDLSFSAPKMIEFPYELVRLDNLERLQISNTPLDSVPDVFAGSPKIKKIQFIKD